MDADALGRRVETRYLPGEAVPDARVIREAVETIADRLRIRLGCAELPALAESIVVDAAIKALRLRGYEGSKSEGASDGGSITNTFVDDVLEAYGADIAQLRRTVHAGGVKFL